jgi:hypothetical protein
VVVIVMALGNVQAIPRNYHSVFLDKSQAKYGIAGNKLEISNKSLILLRNQFQYFDGIDDKNVGSANPNLTFKISKHAPSLS